VEGILRQGRAWVRVLKTAALFVLPLPLLFAFLAALLSGDFARVGTITGGLAAFGAAGLLTWRALVAAPACTKRKALPSSSRKSDALA